MKIVEQRIAGGGGGGWDSAKGAADGALLALREAQ